MDDLTFTEFTEKIAANIKSYLPEEYQDADVKILKNPKPGGTTFTGITVLRPHDTTSPICYLDDIYQGYYFGLSFDEVLTQLAQEVLAKADISPDVLPYLEWNTARDLIVSRLINTARNAEYIADRPSIPVKDSVLAVIFDIAFPEPSEDNLTIPVTYSLLEYWGLTSSDLESAARSNNPRLRPVSIRAIGKVLSELVSDELPVDLPELFFVITNQDCYHGAVTVTYEGVEDCLKQLLGDFYLIPSRIHEMLAVSRSMADPATLAAIIREINDTQVPTQDVLDNIPYTLQDGQLIPVHIREEDAD